MNYKKLVGALAAVSAFTWAVPALAVVTLTLESPGLAQYQQTANSPCVIGESSCSGPLTPGEIPAGNLSSYDVTSEAYSIQTIRGIVGNFFFVGIDVNTTTQPLATERLDFFGAYVNGALEFQYDPASPGTQLTTLSNGNGYSDALLKGFNISTFLPTDIITFRTIVNTPTDGREQFFLISSAANPGGPGTSVPEPGSSAILGLGLLAMGYTALRRKKS